MLNFTIDEIKGITKATLTQRADTKILKKKVKEISIDSRSIKKGDVFVAIKGTRFDGHDFIGAAVRKGASVVILSKKQKRVPSSTPSLYVKDTTIALGLIAQAHRRKFKIPVIAITGSTGKTTTKEMVASVLSQRYKVLKNIATQNNHIGIPLTLLRLNPTHDVAVVELGTNRFGDIRLLTKITEPQIAIYTNIGESHLELLNSPRGVFREKYDLIKGMPKNKKIIFNRDDPYLKKISKRQGRRKLITYSIKERSDYRAAQIKRRDNFSLLFKVNKSHSFKLSTAVTHNIYNALAAISCGRLLKIRYNDIQGRLARFRFPSGRLVVKKFHKCWIIDDTYNANPLSFRSAINTIRNINIRGRKILVCADMLELGKKARQLHQSIGQLAADSDLNLILSFGRMARLITQAAHKKNNGVVAYHCPTLKAVHSRLKNYCKAGDVILVKGSRSMHMERTIDFLHKNLK